MHAAGYELGNLNATLIPQSLSLAHIRKPLERIYCEVLGADLTVVNLKAKAHEKADSLGEIQTTAAHTVLLLMGK
ncbi:2-C-methyl-D-erythritol 2,4-cyclodiphosphate synthase, chloroplastic [Apostasia shenzhenica]|uniref:2-C-methyl-D-erythritol 2,4-cyclodiphosphate synthase, chloroplastic n=1 Tax=Apostasia shenzhenica TaxID=1088818 RepID=A0A2I0B1K1_9ASPA|nr:2-C-methyl-D-erythritol 2,4-cyclodiphosphate synthase, chloroplastic [Apostasia shenzhenica]